VVILVIEVQNFSFGSVDPECQAPVARDREAPCSLAVASELVNSSARNTPKLPGVFHLLEERRYVADLLDDSGRKAGSIVTLDESPQSTMDDIPDLQSGIIAAMVSPVKFRFTPSPLLTFSYP
jgi:hypothetical protein